MCALLAAWDVFRDVLHVLVFCYGTSAFFDMTLRSVVVLHVVFHLAVLVCWFDAMFYSSLTLDVSYCVLTTCWLACWNWTCRLRGQAYTCLRLYAFDRDDVHCWPPCTRRTPADTSSTTNRKSQLTTSSANVSVNDLYQHCHHKPCRSSPLVDTINMQYSHSIDCQAH